MRLPKSISPLEIRQALRRVFASKAFLRSKRLQRFLEYVVIETLEERADSLKEYNIGSIALERGDNFDPRLDSIVRVQAGKLRERLDRYYREEGLDDDVRIQLLPGSYVPLFSRSSQRSVAPGSRPSPSEAPTLAVLPFLNLSGDPGFEYFTDGLSEELISCVGRIPRVHVIARTSSFAFKGQPLGLQQIGQALGAQLILEGSVQQSGETLRVTARLNDAASDRTLWSRKYDTRLEDTLTIKDELSQRIAETIGWTKTLRPAPFVDQESRFLLMQGWRHWHRNDPVHLEKAVERFEQAIERDPSNAQAHAALSLTWTFVGVLYGMPPKKAAALASASAQRATKVGPESEEAWAALGATEAVFHWDWGKAEAAFQRTLDLNPNYALGRHTHAICYLTALGRLDEAAREMDTVLQLDPLSAAANCDLAAILMYSGRYDEALPRYERALELEPNNPRSLAEKGWVLCLSGRCSQGLALIKEALDAAPQNGAWWVILALALAVSSKRSEALHALKTARRYSPEGRLVLTFSGYALEMIGDRDGALRQFEESVEWGDPHARYINIHPFAARLRDEPRFQALLRRMRLA